MKIEKVEKYNPKYPSLDNLKKKDAKGKKSLLLAATILTGTMALQGCDPFVAGNMAVTSEDSNCSIESTASENESTEVTIEGDIAVSETSEDELMFLGDKMVSEPEESEVMLTGEAMVSEEELDTLIGRAMFTESK